LLDSLTSLSKKNNQHGQKSAQKNELKGEFWLKMVILLASLDPKARRLADASPKEGGHGGWANRKCT
jgi:hypothetical protein